MERLSRDGVLFCVEDAGRGAPPVLLIHDLGSDHTSLQAYARHVQDRHRTVGVDLLGHGRSNNLPKAYTLAEYADDLAWLCYELGLYRPIAVGKGIGGAIAIELAARYPILLAAVVAVEAHVLLPGARANVEGLIAQPGLREDRKTLGRLVGLAEPRANASRIESLVEAITKTPHLAATWVNALLWDGPGALVHSTVLALHAEAELERGGVESLRRSCPSLRVESLASARLDAMEEAEAFNWALDAFLSGICRSR